MNGSSGLIVEFVGLPGSGKSSGVSMLSSSGVPGHTLFTAARFDEQFAAPASGKKFLRYLTSPRYRERLRVLLRFHRLSSFVIREILKSKRSFSEKLRAFRLFAVCLNRYSLIRKITNENTIVMFEEGMLQRAMTIFVDGLSDVNLRSAQLYLRKIPLPDVLIYLKIKESDAMHHTFQRPRGAIRRFQSLNESQIQKFMSDGALLLEQIEKTFQADPDRNLRLIIVEAASLNELEVKLGRLVPLLAEQNHATNGH